MVATAAAVVAVAAVLMAAVAVTKPLAATAMEVVIHNNQPKMAVGEMVAETATAMVTMTKMARAITAAMATAVMVVFLPDRQ